MLNTITTSEGNNSSTRAFCLLTLIIFAYPINLKLFQIVRPVDIILFFISLYTFGRYFKLLNVNPRLFTYIAVFIILLILSLVFGIFSIGIKTPINFVFFFKYTSVFIFFWTINTLADLLSPHQIRRLLFFLYVTFGLLTINVFLIIWYPLSWIHTLDSYRPYFFFTSKLADSHLLTAYLSNMLIGALVLFKYNVIPIKYKCFYYIILFLSFPILILPGSRSGIIVFLITLALMYSKSFLEHIITTKFWKQKKVLYLFVIVSVLIVAARSVYLLSENNNITAPKLNENPSLYRLYVNVDRAFRYDNIANARLQKIKRSFSDVFLEGPIVIGIGAPSSELIWIDNGVASIILNSGALGLLLSLLIIYEYLKSIKARANQTGSSSTYQALFIITANYIISNFMVSEFFLTSRSIVPFALLSCLIISTIPKQPEAANPIKQLY